MDVESVRGYFNEFLRTMTREHPEIHSVAMLVSDGKEAMLFKAQNHNVVCDDCKRKSN